MINNSFANSMNYWTAQIIFDFWISVSLVEMNDKKNLTLERKRWKLCFKLDR